MNDLFPTEKELRSCALFAALVLLGIGALIGLVIGGAS